MKIFFIILLFINSTLLSQFKYQGKTNWVSLNYIECINNNLPCECFDFRNRDFFELTVDSSRSSFLNGNFLRIKTNNDSLFSFTIINVMKKLDDNKDSIIGNCIIKNDTLFFIKSLNNVTRKLIRIDNYHFISGNPQSLNYINKRLKESHKPTLEKLLKADNINLKCDLQFSLNRIENNGKTWRIELRDDILFIYKWKYPKRRGKPARKRLKRKIKLKSLSNNK